MTDIPEGRRAVSIDELQKAKKRGDTHFLAQVEVKGMCTIFDKDGNMKGQMAITSLEDVAEEVED